MPVRSTMSDLIARERLMIADLTFGSYQFADQSVQDCLDANRDDARYEPLTIAPTIINNALTGNQAATVFSDFYSKFPYWEADVVLQAYFNSAAWVVVTPVASDYIVGHWQFENDVFTTGTSVPGQLPPVFATGKVYDIYAAAADLLEYWAASLAGAYDVTVDGQSLRRSQLMAAKLSLAARYRSLSKPKMARMNRTDVKPEVSSRRMRLLDDGDAVKGA